MRGQSGSSGPIYWGDKPVCAQRDEAEEWQMGQSGLLIQSWACAPACVLTDFNLNLFLWFSSRAFLSVQM